MSGNNTVNILQKPGSAEEKQGPEVAIEILRTVKEIRYGSVEVVVHDGRVVQIERKEKIRFGSENPERRK